MTQNEYDATDGEIFISYVQTEVMLSNPSDNSDPVNQTSEVATSHWTMSGAAFPGAKGYFLPREILTVRSLK